MPLRINTYKPYFIRRFLTAFLIFFAISLGILFVGSTVWKKQEIIAIKLNQQRKVFTEKHLLEHELDEAVLDMQIMSSSQFFRRNFFGQFRLKTDQNLFLGLVQLLMDKKRSYDQVRYLDIHGKEIFRVNRNNGEVTVIPRKNLQDKSDRYYFKDAIKLKKGYIYISPFDLNVENQKIEKPFRPVVRICIPVYNEANEKVGVDVLNYDGSLLLKDLNEQSSIGIGENYLINHDGYFLMAPDTSMEWGFLFKEKKDLTIKKLFPNEYQRILQTEDGQFRSRRGLFTVCTAYPLKEIGDKEFTSYYPKDYSWKVISFVPRKMLSYGALLPVKTICYLYLLSLIIWLTAAYIYANVTYRKFQLHHQLVESEKKLQKAVETKDRFFSIISHDLKNVSGAMSQYLDYMNENQDSFSKEERSMHMKEVTIASNKHNKLLHEILDWSRLQQGKIDFHPVSVSVKELFDEQIALVDLALKNKELQVEMKSEPDLVVFADKGMLNTIFRNLIDNAIKFSYRNNRIELLAKANNDTVELTVRDFGMGMTKSDAQKVFDLTSRVQQRGTEKESGTGFGLKLVGELVHKNGGQIKVVSEQGKGSAFVVTLPAG
ncbi:sensor histidine kinase [Prolixibacter bellariivorans]|uniref:sensor histidine kinase n=1 Tax=Prolixibacter bellariivorans TaxID=314319 RepID=UPI0004707F12|nr:sensor histidine kinase [Prolixibacter bellariivorans]